MDRWEKIAERKIREAMAEGAFENLRGKGRPLDLEENPFEDPSLRMAHRLLRNNGFAPAWIEEGKDIEAAIARLRADRGQGRIIADDFRRAAAALNRRILDFNLRVPSLAVHKRALDPDE